MALGVDFIEVRGTRLAYRRGGAGPALLYLHGTDGLAEWPEMLDELALGCDVVAPDHPGFGATPIPSTIDDISDMAYFYLDAIAALGLDRIHVVGHSLGGWIALEMAVRSTARFASLTLIASAGIHVKGVAKTDIFLIDPEEQAVLSYADPRRGEAAAQRASAEKYQETAIANRIASARLGWQPRFFNPRLERWLHRVDRPTLVLWGEEDRIIPPAYGAAFARLIPGARLTMVPRAGHLPHVERPDLVIPSIQRFIADAAP
ncbi:MAG TPA: alpha/beta fold hydrolase [Stellaceae bacterium]|nr:alpha/beta fold hydrolase [Stellaceae bacterium]